MTSVRRLGGPHEISLKPGESVHLEHAVVLRVNRAWLPLGRIGTGTATLTDRRLLLTLDDAGRAFPFFYDLGLQRPISGTFEIRMRDIDDVLIPGLLMRRAIHEVLIKTGRERIRFCFTKFGWLLVIADRWTAEEWASQIRYYAKRARDAEGRKS